MQNVNGSLHLNAGFVYNPLENNVMLVSRKSFHSCNSTDFVSVIISGNDSIPITKPGHYYYICGVPGHCEAGQKVDIRVLKPSELAPTASPSSSSPIPAPTQHPAKSTASSIDYYSILRPCLLFTSSISLLLLGF